MDKKKIQFIEISIAPFKIGNTMLLPTAHFIMKSYFIQSSKSLDDYAWEPPIISNAEDFNIENTLNQLLKSDVDILCLSVYTWNKTLMYKFAEKFKLYKPDSIIITGGPEMDAFRNLSFFNKHPYIDWVIYGDGEESFTLLLDHLNGHEVQLINAVSNKDRKVYEHIPFNDKTVLRNSPLAYLKDEFTETVNHLSTTSDRKLCLVWETVKGCPFSCSFCDWSSGLHNKVRFWGKDELIPGWKKELNLFTEIGIDSIYWTNPNVGMTNVDEEIIDYLVELKSQNKTPPTFMAPQLSKTKKEYLFSVSGIMDKMINHNLISSIKFDIQDMDKTVLDNIDRPDLDWPEHKNLIKNFLDRHPNLINKYGGRVDLIWGLPGQTFKHAQYSILECLSLSLPIQYFLFQILPATPAAEPEYLEKYKIGIKEVYVNMTHNHNEHINVVTENYSLSEEDWFMGSMLIHLITRAYAWYSKWEPNPKLVRVIEEFNWLRPYFTESYENYKKNNILQITINNIEMNFMEFVQSKHDMLDYLLNIIDAEKLKYIHH